MEGSTQGGHLVSRVVAYVQYMCRDADAERHNDCGKEGPSPPRRAHYD